MGQTDRGPRICGSVIQADLTDVTVGFGTSVFHHFPCENPFTVKASPSEAALSSVAESGGRIAGLLL